MRSVKLGGINGNKSSNSLYFGDYLLAADLTRFFQFKSPGISE